MEPMKCSLISDLPCEILELHLTEDDLLTMQTIFQPFRIMPPDEKLRLMYLEHMQWRKY